MIWISFFAQFILVLIDDSFEFSIFGDMSLWKASAQEVEMTPQKSWVSICIIFLFTLLTIRSVQKTRRDAKVALESYMADMTQFKDSECLKSRTILVKGILPQDRTGEGIE